MEKIFIFNFSEQAAFVCLMMRQRSENVLEFTRGNYFYTNFCTFCYSVRFFFIMQ